MCVPSPAPIPGNARPRRATRPQDLNGGVFRLGYNANSSYGAHSYFGVVGDVRFMIDAPRWSAHLVSWMEGNGGLDHILLTHRDDVATQPAMRSISGRKCGFMKKMPIARRLPLAWDTERQALRGYREFCWYDWVTQLVSLSRLSKAV
jgi:hypothetical protein